MVRRYPREFSRYETGPFFLGGRNNSLALTPKASARRWMFTRPMFRLPLSQLLT